MNESPTSIAPEPYFSGALGLFYWVSLALRNHADEFTAEQLSDLGDALHNIPDSLSHYGRFFDEQKIRDNYLAAYDQKWGSSSPELNLGKLLDNCIEQVSKS